MLLNKKIFFLLISGIFFFFSCTEQANYSSIDTTPPVTTAKPAGGIFEYPLTVTLSTNETSKIYYAIGDIIPSVGNPETLVASNKAEIYIDHSTSLRFFAIDEKGNIETLKKEEYIFETSPEPPELHCNITTPSQDIYINNSKIPYTVSGNAWGKNTVLRLVEISPDGGSTWYTASGTTKWEFSFTSNINNDNLFLCRASNGFDFQQLGDNSVHIIVDNISPDISTTINNININSTNLPYTISGTANDSFGEIEKVQLSKDSKIWVDTLGIANWSYEIDVTKGRIDNGTLKIRAIDKAGNYSNIKNIQFSINNSFPKIKLISPKFFSEIYSNTTTISVVTDQISTIAIYLFDDITELWGNKIDEKSTTKNASFEITLPDGFQLIMIKATNSAGNTSNIIIPLYKSGIIFNKKPVFLFNDNRFYLKPITVTSSKHYFSTSGNYYLLHKQDLHNWGTAETNIDFSLEKINFDYFNMKSYNNTVSGTISNISSGKQIFIGVYDNFKLKDSFTNSGFYGIPLTYSIITSISNNIEYSFKISDSSLSKGITVMAFQDDNINTYWDKEEKSGYYNSQINSQGKYDFTLSNISGNYKIFINGKELTGNNQNNPINLTNYSTSTTIQISDCIKDTVYTGLWADSNNNGTVDNNEVWFIKQFNDGEFNNFTNTGDQNLIRDGKINFYLSDIYPNINFNTLPFVIFTGNKNNLTVIYMQNKQQNSTLTFSTKVTDFDTGLALSNTIVILLSTETENIVNIGETEANGNVSFSINTSDNFYIMAIKNSYVNYGIIKTTNLSNGDNYNLTLKKGTYEITGKLEDNQGNAIHNSLLLVTSECYYPYLTYAAVETDGSFKFSIHDYTINSSQTNNIWDINMHLFDNYGFNQTISTNYYTFSASTNIGAIKIGEKLKLSLYSDLNLYETNFLFNDGTIMQDSFYTANTNSVIDIIPSKENKYYITYNNIDLTNSNLRKKVLLKGLNKTTYNVSAIFKDNNGNPYKCFYIFYDNLNNVTKFGRCNTNGILNEKLYQSEWTLYYNYLPEELLNGNYFIKKHISITDDINLGVITAYKNISLGGYFYNIPQTISGQIYKIVAENPITGTKYSSETTETSPNFYFSNIYPGDYILKLISSDNSIYYYNYPSLGKTGINIIKINKGESKFITDFDLSK